MNKHNNLHFQDIPKCIDCCTNCNHFHFYSIVSDTPHLGGGHCKLHNHEVKEIAVCDDYVISNIIKKAKETSMGKICAKCGTYVMQPVEAECLKCGGPLVDSHINKKEADNTILDESKFEHLFKLAQSQKQEMFEYQVSINGCVKQVFINFVNDRFENVSFDFKNPYSREEWKVLVEIEKAITILEQQKVKKPNAFGISNA